VNARLYPALVTVWVLAAVVAVASTMGRGEVVVDHEVEALPTLEPGRRAPASFETEDTLPSALSGVVVQPVQGAWTGPGGRPFYLAVRSRSDADYRYRQIGRSTWYLGLRLTPPPLASDACVSCHGAQGLVDGRRGGDAEEVHQNIRPVHPEQAGAECLACHSAENPGRLRTGRGETVELDHAYQLCAQCHFRQVESWSYGAHGKRLVGWRGRRVVMGCADCHDPHAPGTESRPPYAGVQLPGPLSGESHGEAEVARGATEGHGGAHE
jgi:hypothetical protein